MNYPDSPLLASEARQRFLDLLIVGVLPLNLPQYAVPHCPMELALRMTQDENFPWEIDDQNLAWRTLR